MEPAGKLDNCFDDHVIEPVAVVDVSPVSRPNQARTSFHEFSTLQQLTAHEFEGEYTSRYISICQRNSWRPLQITRPMMEDIVSRHGIHSTFWDLPSCFYKRNLDVEEVVCIPYTERRSGAHIEISYTIRYPMFKSSDNKWVLRQSGIYHRVNTETGQSLYVLLNPEANSKLHVQAKEFLRTYNKDGPVDPFWLHKMLLSTYMPSWRQYIAWHERRFLPIANTAFATYIKEPLVLGYDSLTSLVSVQVRLGQVPTILSSAEETLVELSTLLESLSDSEGAQELRNHKRHCASYARSATHLQERAQTTAQLLADTLLFRDQVVSKEQNGHMLQLNKSAVFITTLTLLYLPASFVATFFGMNFFGFDHNDSGNKIMGTAMIYIYIVASLMLTTGTFFLYYWLIQRDSQGLLKKLAPTTSSVVRRLTSGLSSRGLELQTLPR